jgi:hypothetical protein
METCPFDIQLHSRAKADGSHLTGNAADLSAASSENLKGGLLFSEVEGVNRSLLSQHRNPVHYLYYIDEWVGDPREP